MSHHDLIATVNPRKVDRFLAGLDQPDLGFPARKGKGGQRKSSSTRAPGAVAQTRDRVKLAGSDQWRAAPDEVGAPDAPMVSEPAGVPQEPVSSVSSVGAGVLGETPASSDQMPIPATTETPKARRKLRGKGEAGQPSRTGVLKPCAFRVQEIEQKAVLGIIALRDGSTRLGRISRVDLALLATSDTGTPLPRLPPLGALIMVIPVAIATNGTMNCSEQRWLNQRLFHFFCVGQVYPNATVLCRLPNHDYLIAMGGFRAVLAGLRGTSLEIHGRYPVRIVAKDAKAFKIETELVSFG